VQWFFRHARLSQWAAICEIMKKKWCAAAGLRKNIAGNPTDAFTPEQG